MECELVKNQRPVGDLAAGYCTNARAKRTIITPNQPLQSSLGREEQSRVVLHEFMLGAVVVMEKRTCDDLAALHTEALMWRDNDSHKNLWYRSEMDGERIWMNTYS